jgi:NADH dehydrogenase
MRVAIFGAGYAGLTLARRLAGRLPSEVELVVVDETDHHLVQHEIHRAVRRPEVIDDLMLPLVDLLDRAELREARVADVDPAAGEATFEDGETLAYDVGAVCLGAETAFYDLPGVEDHATPLKRPGHAADIRADFLDVIGAGGGRVVVGGAGLSGIQVAGELAALAREEGASEAVEVRLLEQEPMVAPNFPERFQRAVEEELVARDVVVQTAAPVAEADAETVTLAAGEKIEYDQLVWTGGIRGPAALDGERPMTRSHLRLAGDTFVVGDAARVVDGDGAAVPASAQAAVREARVAADNVSRLVDHRLADDDGFEPRLDRYRFDSPGWLVSVGDGAVAQVGNMVLTGPPAIALKTTVGAGYLTSIGSVREAVDLVREELSLDALAGDITDLDEEVLPGDGEDPSAPEEPVDLDIDDDAAGEEADTTDDADA